jgi:hypothetical protein
MRCKHGWKIEPQNSRLFCTHVKYYLEQEKKDKWIKEGFSGLGCTSFIQIFTAIGRRSTPALDSEFAIEKSRYQQSL